MHKQLQTFQGKEGCFDNSPSAFMRCVSQIKEGFLELIYPQSCCACNKPGKVLCDECAQKLYIHEQTSACKNCGAPFGALTCTECYEDSWECTQVISATSYQHPADLIVKTYKDKGERSLSKIMAFYMWEALREAHAGAPAPSRNEDNYNCSRSGKESSCLLKDIYRGLCFMPATREAYRRRGFDHMQLLAQELSRLSKIELLDVLCKDKTRDQRSLDKSERRENVRGSIRLLEPGMRAKIEGKTILLIDDVITTGASMREAATCLLEQGAEGVCGLSFARVW